MGWLAGKRIAAEVAARLGTAADKSLIVAFDSKLAARLASSGHDVTFVSDDERDRSRATTPAISVVELLELAEPSFAGAVVVGAAGRPNGATELREFCQALTRGPARTMVLVDRGQRHVASKAALLGGMTRLEQSVASRVVITSGTLLPPVAT